MAIASGIHRGEQREPLSPHCAPKLLLELEQLSHTTFVVIVET